MDDNIVRVSIPYQEMVWGDILMTLEKDSNVSREDFIKGIQEETIDPWAFVTTEEWISNDSDDPQVSYEEAEEIL
jgi:hypothetical protein